MFVTFLYRLVGGRLYLSDGSLKRLTSFVGAALFIPWVQDAVDAVNDIFIHGWQIGRYDTSSHGHGIQKTHTNAFIESWGHIESIFAHGVSQLRLLIEPNRFAYFKMMEKIAGFRTIGRRR